MIGRSSMFGLDWGKSKKDTPPPITTQPIEKRDGEYSTKEYPILTSGKKRYNGNAILGFIVSLVALVLSWSYINFAGIISIISLYFCFVARVQVKKDATQKGMSWANCGIILAFLGIIVNIVYLVLKLGFHII